MGSFHGPEEPAVPGECKKLLHLPRRVRAGCRSHGRESVAGLLRRARREVVGGGEHAVDREARHLLKRTIPKPDGELRGPVRAGRHHVGP